jgi:hypothetical protein
MSKIVCPEPGSQVTVGSVPYGMCPKCFGSLLTTGHVCQHWVGVKQQTCRFCGSADIRKNIHNTGISVVEIDGTYCAGCGRVQ